MKATTNQTSKILYIIFLLYVIALTAVCSFAQNDEIKNSFQEQSCCNYSELGVYPNPSNNYCNVVLPEVFNYSNLKIEVHGIGGEVKHTYACYSISEYGFIIDLANFINGTYTVQVVNGSRTYLQKMVVNK